MSKVKKSNWAIINVGTPVRTNWHNYPSSIDDQGKIKINKIIEKQLLGKVGYINNFPGHEPYTALKLIGGESLLVNPDLLVPHKIKAVPKEIKAQLTVGSEWILSESTDIICNDTGPRFSRFEHVKNYPAGTKITILNNKAKRDTTFINENYHNVSIDGKETYIVIRFIVDKMKLAATGEQKTYWRLHSKDGTLITKKRFDSLTATKKSRDYFMGNTSSGPEDNYWLENTEPQINDGWYAAQYDYESDNLLCKENI